MQPKQCRRVIKTLLPLALILPSHPPPADCGKCQVDKPTGNRGLASITFTTDKVAQLRRACWGRGRGRYRQEETKGKTEGKGRKKMGEKTVTDTCDASSSQHG